MIRFRAALLCVTPFFSTMFAVGCGGDRSRSPTCGMARLIGPSLIQERLKRLPFVLTDAPRGLPGSLPVLVAGTNLQSTVQVSYTKGALAMEYQGAGFPTAAVTDSTVYAALVVDDSTQRAQGVLIYESQRPPAGYPSVGELTAGNRGIPLYAVRVEWQGVSNPRCPLFAPAPSPQSPVPAPTPRS
jgi:hypothetical protein